MVKIKLSALDLLRNSGYQIVEEDKQVIIRFNPPSINEAMGSDEEFEEEKRIIEIIAKKENDELVILDAYIIEGNNKKRKLDLSELELWAEYLGGE